MAEQPPYDRFARRGALSRRGYVLALLIPVLLAAGGFGVLSLLDHGADTTADTTVRVPTSDWIPGQAGGNEPIQGTLSVDDRRCVYLQTGGGEEVWPVWPAGYRARVDDQGSLSVYDGHDQLVAREGQQLQASGIFTSPRSFSGESCLPPDGRVAVVQSQVTALG